MTPSSGQPVSLDDLVTLNDEIIALAEAGVPLEFGLSQLGSDLSGSLAMISSSLAAHLIRGENLADAIAAERDRGSLPEIYSAVVQAGLKAGRLPAALEALTEYATTLSELRQQIVQALIYPLLVIAFAFALFVVLVLQVSAYFQTTFGVLQVPLGSRSNCWR